MSGTCPSRFFYYLSFCLRAVVTLLSWISAEERSHEHNLTS